MVAVPRGWNKSRRSRNAGRIERSQRELAGAFAGNAEYRRGVDERRSALAARAAEPLIAALIDLAEARSDAGLEDELCARLGARLAELDDGPVDDQVGPGLLAEAAICAGATAVAAALGEPDDGWRSPWRVLTAVAGILPEPLSELAADAIEGLRERPGGRRLPETIRGPALSGPVLWARDGYGSRFGIAAAVGPNRWYLWDIDACGPDACTVHSGYSATPEQALMRWRAGVGEVAAGATVFAPVDNPELLADLLPREQGMLRPGGENVQQFAEYHRSKRLAEAVLEAFETAGPPPVAGLDAATAAPRFIAWLRARRAERPLPAGLDEDVFELAGSWHLSGSAFRYGTCSPHRVALVVDHVRSHYVGDLAADLIALLPDWTAWLAELNATAPHLAERCRPYLQGAPYPGLSRDDSASRYLSRVIE